MSMDFDEYGLQGFDEYGLQCFDGDGLQSFDEYGLQCSGCISQRQAAPGSGDDVCVSGL